MIREANLILRWKVTMQVSAGSCGPDGPNNPYFLLLKNGALNEGPRRVRPDVDDVRRASLKGRDLLENENLLSAFNGLNILILRTRRFGLGAHHFPCVSSWFWPAGNHFVELRTGEAKL